MRIGTGFDFDLYDIVDYINFDAYINDLIVNKDKIVAHMWSSRNQFGQIVLIKG
jgi:hypothetical protein